MIHSKKFRKTSVALAVASVVAVAAVAVAAAGPPSAKGGGKKPKGPTTTTTIEVVTPPVSVNAADVGFVEMMIPHHFQATLMSELAPERSGDERLSAFADRIGVEQTVEIGMMQNWQTWNELDVTDAEASYEMMLSMPMMLEQMGMATADQMDDLGDASGTDFDRMYLELMIAHHEGALEMLTTVLIEGTDDTLEFWATDMLTAQTFQIEQMEAMLADLG